MVDGYFILCTILMVEHHGQGFAGSECGETDDIDGVVLLYLVIVFLIGKGEGEHTLFFQVGLVDTGEASYHDGPDAEVAGLHGGVFAGGTFTIVLVPYNDGADAGCLVGSCSGGNGAIFSGELILYGVRLFIKVVDGSDEHVVGDIVEVSTEFQPGAGHGDMVGGTFS